MYPCIVKGVVTPSSQKLKRMIEVVQIISVPFKPLRYSEINSISEAEVHKLAYTARGVSG